MMYRGTTKEGKEVEGSLIIYKAYDLNDGTHKPTPLRTVICKQEIEWINDPNDKRWTFPSFEVSPSSLAMSTGIKDKNKVEIFGSFPVDGVMSEGGSNVSQLYNPAKKLYRTGVVEYCKDLATFSLIRADGQSYELTIMVGSRCGERLEVIPKEQE